MGRERPISDEREVRSFGPFGKWKNDDEPTEMPVHDGEYVPSPEDKLIDQIDAKRSLERASQVDNPEPGNTQDEIMVDELMEDSLREAQQLEAANRHGELQRAKVDQEGVQVGAPRTEGQTLSQDYERMHREANRFGKRNENSKDINSDAAIRKVRVEKQKDRAEL